MKLRPARVVLALLFLVLAFGVGYQLGSRGERQSLSIILTAGAGAAFDDLLRGHKDDLFIQQGARLVAEYVSLEPFHSRGGMH